VLVNVHLLLNLLHQTLLLLVLRSRATRSNARLLLVRNNARLLVLRQSRTGPASGLSSANVARGVAACGGGQASVDGVDLHALALGVGVFADLLAAGEGDGVGVDVGGAALLGVLVGGVGVIGLCWGDGATAAGERVGGLGGAGQAAASGLVGDVGGGIGRA